MKNIERVFDDIIRNQVDVNSMAMFILPQTLEKYLTGNRNTYSTCVDPIKSFDRVPETILWFSMCKTPNAIHDGVEFKVI